MHNLIDQEELDASNEAASLSRIQVRKPKTDINAESAASAKAGDITDRLAMLSEELDREVVDNGNRTDSNASVITPTPFSAPQPQAPRNTGWGRQKKQAAPDILSYWMDIRKGRRYPTWESLDPALIGSHWPNCVLVHCNKELGRLQVKYEFTNAVRKAALSSATAEERIDRIEFTPMVIDWILGLARDVALSGKPAHGSEHFPSLKGEFPLRLIALPLSTDLRSIDHVLCYIQQLR